MHACLSKLIRQWWKIDTSVDPCIASMGLRHEHKLASIAQVGQNLLVPISWQGETKMSQKHFKIPSVMPQ